MKYTRWVVGALAIVMLASCKIRIVVSSAGNVVTTSASYKCYGGRSCDIDVVDFYFDETFVAKPISGYEFKHWKAREGGWCPNYSKECRLSTKFFEGEWIPLVLAWLESDAVTYLEPVFERAEITHPSDCSVYVPGTNFCMEGSYKDCLLTTTQSHNIKSGAPYADVIDFIGCHGEFRNYKPSANNLETLVTYRWWSGIDLYDTKIEFSTTAFGTGPLVVQRVIRSAPSQH